MTRRKWAVFAAIQIAGCVATLFVFRAMHGDVRIGWSALRAFHLTGFFLLLPGNLVGGALIQTFRLYPPGRLHSTYLFYLPVTVMINAGFCLLCAAAWRTVREHVSGVRAHRFAIALLTVAIVFVCANIVDFMRPATCFDCFLRRGFPFHLYHEGGFAGGAAIMWGGLAADAFIVVAIAMLLGTLWSWTLRRSCD
jgi:hypothetical protein